MKYYTLEIICKKDHKLTEHQTQDERDKFAQGQFKVLENTFDVVSVIKLDLIDGKLKINGKLEAYNA